MPSSHPIAPVTVVGAGRLGSAIAAALRSAGVDVRGPLRRDEPVTALGADAIVLLCVPDAAIAAAADAVTAGPILAHCSGASGLELLGDRRSFSLHPLMTVTGPDSDLRGAAAAIDGSDAATLQLAAECAELLGMEPVRVRPEDRPAYHAAASIAANFLVTLETAAERLAATAGVTRAQLAPLVRASAANWAAGGAAALTGPVARGDAATVARQRAAVAERTPDLLGLFDVMVAATESLAAAAESRPATIESTVTDTAGLAA